ncbi:class A beta-lactamase-related serine hydrolase [Dyadobacter sp. CY345]|uniref:serine hydrolase n=1 Tax=Dyadobacter sp. CY345 TaxID=2909335 RepID=UPI001F408438|nr:serine hydrolase [Dyadobacter sp. CY345]MCF2442880.1 class A beta-lactamase-related serine hydrolase [Dyadobacter sp. CY345]
MKKLIIITLLCLNAQIFAQPFSNSSHKTDRQLVAKLEKATAGFKGNVGVYVRNLKTNKTASVNQDSIFPTASMVKIPIMVGLFDKIQKGEIKFDQTLIYRDSLKYDDGIVGSLKDSTKIPMPKVVHLMISLSDNTGSLWLQALAGGGAAINQWMDNNGFEYTRVNSRTPGRKQAQATYGWGQTTPREMAELMVMIREGKAISADASERMYRYLGMQFWDGEALSQIPSNIKTSAKSGAVNQAKSEVVMVHAPHGDYVFCITTKNQLDERWERSNEGYVLIRKVSEIIWNHFEPKSKWKPVENYEKWWF